MSFIPDELQELRRELTLERQHGESRAEMWEQYFNDVSPTDFYETLSKNLPGDLKLRLEHGEGSGEVYLHFSLRDDLRRESSEFAEGRLLFGMNEYPPTVELESFEIENGSRRGKGVAKQFLANLMDVMEMDGVNVSAITLEATNVGGYAWARFGFVPRDDEWPHLKNKLLSGLEGLKDELAESVYQSARTVIEQAEPEDLAVIAKMGGALKSTDPDLDTMTLGQRLLVGTRWKGMMDSENELSTMRFDTYTDRAATRTLEHARSSR